MKNFIRIGAAFAALVIAVVTSAQAQDQESGFKRFMHRAGAAVSQTTSKVLGNTSAAPGGQAAGPAKTTGAYYRPINPSIPGAIVGIFDQHRMGDAWPRVAVRFTRAGADQACWTAQATIWRSPKDRRTETFDICNSPLAFTDAMGQTHFMTAPEDAPGGGQGTLAFSIAQNIQGMSHVDTAPGDARDTELPPNMLFYLGTDSQTGTLAHQYHEILVRLMWLTGWMSHSNPTIDIRSGKTLWVVGIDANSSRPQEPSR
ncbi:hypothetical protein J2X57_000085 [Luteibacter sp. 1214]|uniref:hypothetical protein n=1 Tax=Luteibacter sp. 1214 TaxID=2817735 RepID=UPI00285F383E|nr:hypothetical protein [Luteibacter sp. 1214]MDR6640891.1 hypothetical protein [Luteibacter sp. 1214]